MKQITANGIEEKKHICRCIFLVGVFLLLDQVSKVIVENNIVTPIQVIPRFFNLVYVKNTGAAWGILADKGWLLLTVSIVVFILIIVYLRMLAEGWSERYYALALILSGILGNVSDRLWRGSVVDFLDFYIDKYHWPAFNIADSAICVGVFIFIISSLFRPQITKN